MAAQLKNEVENNVKNTEVNQNQTDAESNGSSVLNFVLWLVVITLLCAAVAGNYFFNKFYADLFASNSLYALLKGLAVVVIILIAVVVALFTTSGKSVLNFTKESVREVKKVVWPTGTEARTTTIMIGVVTFVVALMLWIFDSIFLNVIRFITNL
ncbi:MAG: preprotein translocase subunit SecE [Succinivibrionaceae bacterium]|nr:preprotein translocase subunit SecE [Succinivibrionaceae bacterium]MEE1340720.1 preprotein translocase subunit SecE [Succinivibrionaceae bacterium]